MTSTLNNGKTEGWRALLATRIFSMVPEGVARLGGATAGYTLANFGTKALSFLLLFPLYTRFLAPAEFGIVSLSESMAVVVATIYASTFEVSIQRFYYRHDDPTRRRACISTLMQVGGSLILVICALAFSLGPTILTRFLPSFRVAFYPYLALAIGTFALTQFVSYRLVLYQAERKTASYVLLSVSLFVAIAVCTVIAIVVARWGATGMLVGKFIPTLLMAMFSIYLLRNWFVRGWDRETLTEFKNFTIPMAAYPFIVLGLNIADRLILERYRSESEVGIYSLAYGVGMAMSLIALSLYQAWTPVFYKTATQGEQSKPKNARLVTSVLLLKVFFAVIGVALSPLFVSRIMDARYREGAVLVPYIICGYLFRGFAFSFHVPLLAAGKTLATSASGAIALAVNLLLNFAFIPQYGMRAAAYATAIAYAVELVVVYAFAQRINHLPYARGKLALGLGVLAAAFTVSQTSFRENIPVVLLTVTIAGGSVLWMLGKVVTQKPTQT